VSCNIISREELAKMIPVIPPMVNRKTNPKAHNIAGSYAIFALSIVVIQLKILIPVGIAMIIVAAVK
jgi:hypothetical protein